MVEDSVQIGDIETLFRWEKALLLLSLDRVKPFLEDMGFRAADEPVIRDAIRGLLREQQKRQYDDTMVIYFRAMSAELSAMFDVIHTTGEENAAAVRDWVVNTYSVFIRKERWYETWQVLFLRLAEGCVSQLSGQGISEDKLATLKELVEEWRDREEGINDRIQIADETPLVGWDAQQYSRYRRESPDASPLDYLSDFLNNYAFFGYWERLVCLFLPWEIAVLNRWGQIYTAVKTTIPPVLAELPPQYIGGHVAPG